MKEDSKKIVHIIIGLGVGGAESMLCKILENYNNKDIQPFVISLMNTKSYIRERIENLGVPVYTLNMKRGIPDPCNVIKLIKIVRKIKPDIIQGWMYHGNIAGYFCSIFLKNVTLIWNIRHSIYNLKDEKLLTAIIIRLSALLSKKPYKIIYNAKISAKQHEKLNYSPDKTLVIPNGFDLKRFKYRNEARNYYRKKMNISEEAFLIGMIARYHPLKDHINFIEAAKIVVTEYPKVHFLLVGSNLKNNKIIDEAIHRYNLKDYFTILDETEDINNLLSAFDLSVLSSFSEGFPNVIGESMACSIPCVVTDVGDASWIVGDTGIVVEPKNPQSLAKGILQMISLEPSERQRLGIEARKRVSKYFSVEFVTEQYIKLYKSVLKI